MPDDDDRKHIERIAAGGKDDEDDCKHIELIAACQDVKRFSF